MAAISEIYRSNRHQHLWQKHLGMAGGGSESLAATWPKWLKRERRKISK
jgi:hypothetical protein